MAIYEFNVLHIERESAVNPPLTCAGMFYKLAQPWPRIWTCFFNITHNL